MNVNLRTEHNLEFLSLKGGYEMDPDASNKSAEHSTHPRILISALPICLLELTIHKLATMQNDNFPASLCS